MTASPGRPFAIVCVSSQDWYADLPTNRQQIMRRAARAGHPVLFVETGSFLGSHLWRLLRGGGRRSLARRLLGGEHPEPGIEVLTTANLVPWGRKYRLAASLNARSTARRIRRRSAGRHGPVVLWLYDPAADLIGACGEDLAVYDCVDDHAAQARPGRRRAVIADADRRAATRARLVFATSRGTLDRQRALNPRVEYVPNVGDYEHFSPAADRRRAAAEVAGLPRPVLGFAGNLLAGKVDFDLLEQLATARPDWSLLLVGPAADGAAADRLARLGRLPNVHWVGPKPYSEVPRYVAAFDVGLIPYWENDYTRSCFPLKLYEYLAAGKPVVATGVAEAAGMEPHVTLVADAGAVAAAVERALATGEDGREARRRLAARNTWESRAARLLELVSAELA
jgi:glycosyltransferase involved in cell wall biosynthesis